eukprot:768183-Hanusia_phi.AAC.1
MAISACCRSVKLRRRRSLLSHPPSQARALSMEAIGALCLVVLGAVGFVLSDKGFVISNMFWVFMYGCANAAYPLVTKVRSFVRSSITDSLPPSLRCRLSDGDPIERHDIVGKNILQQLDVSVVWSCSTSSPTAHGSAGHSLCFFLEFLSWGSIEPL